MVLILSSLHACACVVPTWRITQLGMERTVRQRNQLPTNLPQLQNLIKRDGDLYKDEVAITQ